MKILFSAETLYPVLGGADISARTLLEELAKEHEVHAIYIGKSFKTNLNLHPVRLKTKKGIWIKSYFLNKKWKRILEQRINQIKPDLIITQETLIPATIEVANKYNLKTISFIRSYLHLSINGFMPTEKKKYLLQTPFYKLMHRRYERALRNSTIVVSNSNYLKNLTKKRLGIDSEVIYPFIDLKNYKTKTTQEYISMVNPDHHKGLYIFQKLIRLLPKRKFLAIGKKVKGAKSLPWINDLKKEYARTRILLAPSIWPEPFGRMCVEAMASGIPCIVSNKGELPQVVGNAGIVLSPNKIKGWVEAIRKLDNAKYYRSLSKKAVKQAKKFDSDVQLKKFNEILKNL